MIPTNSLLSVLSGFMILLLQYCEYVYHIKKGNEPCPVLNTRIAIQRDKEQCTTVSIYSSTNQDFEPYSTNKTQVELNIS